MKQLLLCCGILLTTQLMGQFTPVILNGEVFYKVELELAEGAIVSEVTIGDFDVLDGQVYQRAFLKRGFNADELIGHVREDPSIGQVVFRPLNGNDQLSYDISLSVGESIDLNARWCDGQGDNTATVVSEEEDEEGRKVLTFDRQVGGAEICETLQFIEGIGPSAGIILPYFVGNDLTTGVALRICHVSRGGEIFYPMDVVFDLCGVPTTDTGEAERQVFRVFPNPVINQLQLPDVLAEDQLELFDLMGRSLRQWQGQETINMADLPLGMYLLEVRRNGRPFAQHKLVKK